jgi:hippurate hydrolase
LPDDKAPVVTVIETESTPVVSNDPALTSRVKAALVATLGADKVFEADPVMGSEDFGVFGLEGHKIPVSFFNIGAMQPDKFAAAQAAGKLLPGPHTSKFEPDPAPTLETGVRSMTGVAVALLQ